MLIIFCIQKDYTERKNTSCGDWCSYLTSLFLIIVTDDEPGKKLLGFIAEPSEHALAIYLKIVLLSTTKLKIFMQFADFEKF